MLQYVEKVVRHISKSNISASSSNGEGILCMMYQNLSKTQKARNKEINNKFENFVLTDCRVKATIITKEIRVSEISVFKILHDNGQSIGTLNSLASES